MLFLSERILGYRSWYAFAANHLEYSDLYKGQIVRTHNAEWIAAKIRPYVYQVTKDECLDLPDKVRADRDCILTWEQDAAYQSAKERFYEDVMSYDDGGQWKSSIPIFRLFTSLQSIVTGWDGHCKVPLPSFRIDLLQSALNAIPADEPVVVWAKYHHAIRQILKKIDSNAAQFHGGLSETARERELTRWRSGDTRLLIATQAAGGHGLDLTAARYAVFYASGFKYSEQVQAEDRQHRLGQTRKVTYIRLWANCKIEERIAGALHGKGSALREFREEVDKVKAGRKENLKRLLETL
jgi:SNF2 family DNA or RNA helicase